MQLDSVATTGAALAACLRTVATSGEGYGLLFGKNQAYQTLVALRLQTA